MPVHHWVFIMYTVALQIPTTYAGRYYYSHLHRSSLGLGKVRQFHQGRHSEKVKSWFRAMSFMTGWRSHTASWCNMWPGGWHGARHSVAQLLSLGAWDWLCTTPKSQLLHQKNENIVQTRVLRIKPVTTCNTLYIHLYFLYKNIFYAYISMYISHSRYSSINPV